MKIFFGVLLIMGTSAGYIHWQGLSMLTLSVVFGATDSAQTFLKANPANPHPTVRLPSSD